MSQNDVTCEHCGFSYEFDHTRRCWKCDSVACIYCLTDPPEPLCPECAQRLPDVEPMLAENSTLPADSENWGYEFKWDGIRAFFYWDGQNRRLLSRNLLNVTFRYPEFENLGRFFGDKNIILDGEIVALNDRGRPDFKLLQKRMHLSRDKVSPAVTRTPIHFYIFDCLFYNKRSLIKRYYRDRRQILEDLAIKHPHCRVPPWYSSRGPDLLYAARENGLEGILAKRLDSPYLPGKRSSFWRKIKITSSQEFVIAGWIPQKNTTQRIGSLLLGYYDQANRLRYAGNVGTGFDDNDHKMLVEKLRSLRTNREPFAETSSKKDACFVIPIVVADIEYRRWPEDGHVQQAAYKGIRYDKNPHQVHREEKK